MNADDLRARLEAGFYVAHVAIQAERPEGLTASRLVFCSSAAARILLRQKAAQEGDYFRGLRGGWLHDGMFDSLAAVDPGFTDGRKERFTWDPGGGLPVITGAYDFLLDGIPVEVKTRPRDECRWHTDHGPAPEHCAQVAAAAAAVGAQQAFVIYLPVDSGIEEMAVCEVDVRHWLRETVLWLHRIDVRDEVEAAVEQGVPRERAVERALDPIPREPAVQWCRMFCGYAKSCRGDYVPPEDLEIADPVVRMAVQEYESLRNQRLALEKKEAAAKSKLEHAAGRVSVPGEAPIDLRHPTVPDRPGRRGHTKTTVTRRPG